MIVVDYELGSIHVPLQMQILLEYYYAISSHIETKLESPCFQMTELWHVIINNYFGKSYRLKLYISLQSFILVLRNFNYADNVIMI